MNSTDLETFSRVLVVPPRQDFGYFEDWRIFGDPQTFGKILKLGVALILRYVLTYL